MPCPAATATPPKRSAHCSATLARNASTVLVTSWYRGSFRLRGGAGQSSRAAEPDERGGGEKCGAGEVDGLDADGVGQESAESERREARRVPEDVVEGEDPAAGLGGCLGLDGRLERDHAGRGGDAVGAERGAG